MKILTVLMMKIVMTRPQLHSFQILIDCLLGVSVVDAVAAAAESAFVGRGFDTVGGGGVTENSFYFNICCLFLVCAQRKFIFFFFIWNNLFNDFRNIWYKLLVLYRQVGNGKSKDTFVESSLFEKKTLHLLWLFHTFQFVVIRLQITQELGTKDSEGLCSWESTSYESNIRRRT